MKNSELVEMNSFRLVLHEVGPSKLYLFYAVGAATLVAWTSVLAAILPLLDRHVSDVQRKNGLLRMSRTDRPFCDDFIQTAIHFEAKEGCCKYKKRMRSI